MSYDPEYHRKYREAHKERRSEYQRKYRIDNSERIAETKRRNYAAHKEEIIEQKRNYYKANKEHLLERGRAYYEANIERAKEYKHEHYEKNKQIYHTLSRNRRARTKGVEGIHTAEDVQAIWVRQGMKCAVPGCTFPISDTVGSKNKYHVDHIKPFTRGGSNWPSNLQILCRRHNVRKHNKDEREWALAHGISIEKKENYEA